MGSTNYHGTGRVFIQLKGLKSGLVEARAYTRARNGRRLLGAAIAPPEVMGRALELVSACAVDASPSYFELMLVTHGQPLR